MTAALLHCLGPILAGYDIGCRFSKWVHSHPLVAPLAKQHDFDPVVGSFHGCAHGRKCQCRRLPLYRRGAGLEYFEQAESVFSRSNGLAGTTRHMSAFHRQQEIVEYFAHTDVFEVYANLCTSLSITHS
jgi:hypothetical protein